jgi:hypothetical protein
MSELGVLPTKKYIEELEQRILDLQFKIDLKGLKVPPFNKKKWDLYLKLYERDEDGAAYLMCYDGYVSKEWYKKITGKDFISSQEEK